MVDIAHRPATYADLEAVPPHLVAEILFGDLVTQPRPDRQNGGAGGSLGAILTNSYQFGLGGPGGWVFIIEPELHLGPHMLVADIAGWRVEQITEPPDKADFEVAPDWVCEILSPRTEKYDKGPKRRIYATYGVDHLWFVEPRAKCIEVFQRQDQDWLLTHTCFDDEEVCAAPFVEFKFPLSRLWPFDPPAPSIAG